MNLQQLDIEFRYIYKSSYFIQKVCPDRESNPGPLGYKLDAILTELLMPIYRIDKFETELYRMSFASIFLQVARFYGVELSAYEVNMLTNVP